MYTDIALLLKEIWIDGQKCRIGELDSSGPRIPATKLRPNDNVDTIGMQIRQSNLYWKRSK